MPPYLPIYLKDHHAAGTAGSVLAKRLADKAIFDSTKRGELSTLAEEILVDLRTLEDVMSSLSVPPSKIKDAAAIALAHIGKLKANGHLRQRSPLSDVVELETLMVGIEGKAALWTSLAQALPGYPLDFEALRRRAAQQLDLVSRYRDSAAQRAFTSVHLPGIR